MKIQQKLFLFFIIILLLIAIGFIIKTYVIEKYKKFRKVGLFPLKFDKIVRVSKYRDDNGDDKKYDRHDYRTHRRRYNFLAQRNARQKL